MLAPDAVLAHWLLYSEAVLPWRYHLRAWTCIARCWEGPLAWQARPNALLHSMGVWPFPG